MLPLFSVHHKRMKSKDKPIAVKVQTPLMLALKVGRWLGRHVVTPLV